MILNFARGNWLLFLDFLQVHTEVVPEAGNPATSLLKLTLSQLRLTPDSPRVG